jgi:phosphate transport system substrate-binding protein
VDLPAPTLTQSNRRFAAAVLASLAFLVALVFWDRRAPPRLSSPAGAPVEAADLKASDDRPPRLLKGTPPLAPAQHLAINPTIICRTLVGTDGKVVEARAYQPRPELAEYERAALVAVRQYEFEPAVKGRSSVQAWVNWPVTFADPSQIVGTVRLKGSDTIGGELAPRLGAAFRDERPDLNVTVEAYGTATAFTGLFDQNADIGLASRSADRDEVERAAFLHIKLDEYVFAYDGIAVIVHPQNPINELSLEQVAKIFSGKTKTWKEAGAAKGGGSGAEPPPRTGAIHRLSRPSYSGTHAFFLQRVVKLNRSDSPDGFATDTESVERNEDLVAKVAADPDAIAYVGLGWVHKAVKALALSGDGPAVRPSEDTIQDATYPVSRPLLMYTRGAPSANAAAFLRFVFSSAGQGLIKSAGFVPTEATVLVIVPREKPEVPAYDLFRVAYPERSAAIDATEEPKVSRAVEALKAPRTKVLVVGNADGSEGDAAACLALSEQRSRAMSDYLEKQGVPATSVVVASDGSSHPVAAKGTPGAQGSNRRTDLYVVHEGG